MPSTERVRFPGSGGAELAGRLERPAGEPRGLALLTHCFTCGKDAKGLVRVGRRLVERGLAVFRFDFAGVGESTGEFQETTFGTNVEDVRAAADFLRGHYRPPDLVLGHSLGGLAALVAAAKIPELRAVATLAAPSDTHNLERRLLAAAPELADGVGVEIELIGRRVAIGPRLTADLATWDVRPYLEALGRPLLILHSPDDQIVKVDHARRLYEAAQHPKSFVSLEGADHLLLERRADADSVGDVVAAWAARYLAPIDEGSPLADGEVFVTARGSLVNEVRAGRHRWIADEPKSMGGSDSGPGPYDLLLAALGACKSMTLRMYADRKDWPLESVEVRLTHEKIHARDCRDCESETGKIDRIQIELELTGDLSDEQRRRLLEISERCPVHRTLVTETRIDSTLVS